MRVRLFSTPWAAFAGEHGADLSGKGEQEIQIRGTPRIVCDTAEDVYWDGGRSLTVAAHTTPDGGPAHYDVPLHTSPGVERYQVGTRSGRANLRLNGLPTRVIAAPGQPEAPRERWLQWQVQCYLELGDLGYTPDGHGPEATIGTGFVRRGWESVAKVWHKRERGDATLALIVRLARNQALATALNRIARGPRKQLLRVREPRHISRIQELDAACVRAFSRAPGRTPVEKGGARQQLLTVVRRETVDLIENQLTCWTLRAMTRMAAAYLYRNRDARRSPRYRQVDQLRKLAERLVLSPALGETAPLIHHPRTPTYCLQYESRYRLVWNAYLAILRENRVVDDAWRWHLRQWGTTARLLLGCLLRGMNGWTEELTSTPYFRTEGFEGDWVAGPSTPGPFCTPRGLCHVLDLREASTSDAATSLDIPSVALTSGADLVITWLKTHLLVLMWASVAPVGAGPDTGFENLGMRMRALSASSGWTWKGLIMLAEPEIRPEQGEWIQEEGEVFLLRVPAEVHRKWDDLEAAFVLGMESLNAA